MNRMRGWRHEGLVSMSAYQALIVEDDAPTRVIYTRVLTDAGFDVLEAADGAQALQILERQVPDIVFLDMLLPRIPGAALLNFLITSPQHSEHTVAVVISAHQRFEDVVIRPHDRFLLKPVYPRQLRAAAFEALASASR
jgi:sigma-B regulation protein RsbU (phosphoserine phosphatase)